MNKDRFIENFRNAFGNQELPIVFWYSQQPIAEATKTRGCFIKDLKVAREGGTICLNNDTISCGGGKTYTGFIPAPPNIPNFVSLKERYKETPQLVTDFIENLNMPSKKRGNSLTLPPSKTLIILITLRGCYSLLLPMYYQDWFRGHFSTPMLLMPFRSPLALAVLL